MSRKKASAKSEVEFAKFSDEEWVAVDTIVDRALNSGIVQRERIDIEMDLAAVHAHTPLRLADLALADDFNLMHDVRGIERHLDRSTGALMNCFRPRFAA